MSTFTWIDSETGHEADIGTMATALSAAELTRRSQTPRHSVGFSATSDNAHVMVFFWRAASNPPEFNSVPHSLGVAAKEIGLTFVACMFSDAFMASDDSEQIFVQVFGAAGKAESMVDEFRSRFEAINRRQGILPFVPPIKPIKLT